MKAIYEKLGPLNYFFDQSTETLFINTIFHFLQDLVDKFSRIDKYFLWFTWKLDYQNSHMAAVFVLHRQNCIHKHIMFDKKTRPVFRVGWAVEYEGMKWVEVKGEKLIPFCSDVDVSRSYPVFVQSHALERMKERLYPIRQHDVLLNLSFERGELSRNAAGQLLFAVRFNECKLGYLLTDIVGMKFLRRWRCVEGYKL